MGLDSGNRANAPCSRMLDELQIIRSVGLMIECLQAWSISKMDIWVASSPMEAQAKLEVSKGGIDGDSSNICFFNGRPAEFHGIFMFCFLFLLI